MQLDSRYIIFRHTRQSRANRIRTWQEVYEQDRLRQFCNHAGAVAVLAVVFFIMAILFIGG